MSVKETRYDGFSSDKSLCSFGLNFSLLNINRGFPWEHCGTDHVAIISAIQATHFGNLKTNTSGIIHSQIHLLPIYIQILFLVLARCFNRGLFNYPTQQCQWSVPVTLLQLPYIHFLPPRWFIFLINY